MNVQTAFDLIDDTDTGDAISPATIVATLRSAASWSSFAASLINQRDAGRSWSAKQRAAAESMAIKLIGKADQPAPAAPQISVDLTPIREIFETAVGNGHKRPTYRAEGLVISRAPDHGKNPGALYVKTTHGDYVGKVLGTTFTALRTAEDVSEQLADIARDPLEAAIRYGRRTGKCACCGRELTNKISIDLGIGPICRDKWGL